MEKFQPPASPPDADQPGAAPPFFSRQILKARRFFTDLGAPASQRLAVICGGSEHCTPDYHVARATFRYYSVEFVARGEGSIILQGKRQPLGAGSVFAYGPRVPHDIRSSAERPLVKYFVDFSGAAARKLLTSPRPGQLIHTSAPNHVHQLFEELIDAALRQTTFSTSISLTIFQHILLRIAETAVSPGALDSGAFDTFQSCRDHIETHYLELRSLTDIAARCHVTPEYLCRLFGKYGHESPYQYLMRLKLMEAARRLQAPGALIKQISHELGFGDPFRFSRSFKRVLGVGPRRFIQLQRRNHET